MIDQALADWILRSDPNRPDVGGVRRKHREELVKKLSMAGIDAITPEPLVRKLRALGGPGSGFYDHIGRPGKVGGSSSRGRLTEELSQYDDESLQGFIENPEEWLLEYGDKDEIAEEAQNILDDRNKPIELFHGTSADLYSAISTEGLIAKKVPGADEGMPRQVAEAGGRGASVYLTTKIETAEQFARMMARKRNVEPLVLTVALPASEKDRLKKDYESAPGMGAVRFEGKIEPDWIVDSYSPEPRAYEDTTRFYIVIFLEKAPTALGGEGSGNFGHAGRPGEVGGSADSDVTGKFTRPPREQDPAPGGVYFYHSAPISAIESIAKEGIKSKNTGIISLSPHLDSVNEWSGLIGRKDEESVILRVKRIGVAPVYSGTPLLDEDDPDFDPSKTDEYDANDPGAELATYKTIPPHRLEVHHEGRWKPISSFANLKALGGPGSGNFDHAGRPGLVGGSLPKDYAAAQEEVKSLKAEWTRLNDELFDYVGKDPTLPRVGELIEEQKQLLKRLHRIDADPGGHAGISMPGGARDVVIIGGGPGGLQTAIAAGADGLDTLLVEGSDRSGGQSKFSSRIENYMGFPIGVTGDRLAKDATTQAERMGAEITYNVKATGISHDPVTDLKTVTFDDGSSVTTRSVVIAGGVEFKKAEFPIDDESKVVYGDSRTLARMGAGKDVVVAGGSNGAAQAALLVAKTAENTTVISRKPIEIAMSDYVATALRAHPGIDVRDKGSVITGLKDGHLLLNDGSSVRADAVGVFFGGRSQTGFLPKEIAREERTGKIITDSNMETGMPGVFAVGDMRHKGTGRVGSAVGDGMIATKSIFDYFERVKRMGNVFGGNQ